LVNDDNVSTQKAAVTFNKNLEKIDMGLLKESTAQKTWILLLKELNISSRGISKVTSIKEQRDYFISLSNYISKSIEVFGINKRVYKQFCPMANNDRGAFWLSTEEEIMNPYFGDTMLKCGNIAAIIEN